MNDTHLLTAAMQALRSYQYGNSATDLAKDIADKIEADLKTRDTTGLGLAEALWTVKRCRTEYVANTGADLDLLAKAESEIAALAEGRNDAPRWRHKKRGSTYTEIGRGHLQISSKLRHADSAVLEAHAEAAVIDGLDMTPIVLYRSDEEGSFWARPVEEFDDGRFEKLEPVGWDHRYRQLDKGEIILATDECQQDDGSWRPDSGRCAGTEAPDPAYTSHRIYRRAIAQTKEPSV